MDQILQILIQLFADWINFADSVSKPTHWEFWQDPKTQSGRIP